MAEEKKSGTAPPLTLNGAQAAVDETIQRAGGYWPPLANLARLFEECGELARAVNLEQGPKVRKRGEAAVAVQEELGDALYVLLVLANSLGIDAQEALDASLATVRRRHPRAGTSDAGGPESGGPE